MIAAVNLTIARKHLLSRKKQTLVAMLGVTFGIAMFILMISFMKGVNQFLEDIMISVTPDIHLYNDFKTDYSRSLSARYFGPDPTQWIIVHHPKPKQINLNLRDAMAIVADLRKQQDVAVVSPLTSVQILFNYGPVQLGVITDGVDIREEDRLFGIAEKMDNGRPGDLLTTENGILLGYKLADKLHVTTGDMVSATAPSGARMRFRVAGTYKFGMALMDEYKAYMSLADMQQLVGKGRDYITDIRIKVKDRDQAKRMAEVFALKYGYKADDWETVNASLKAGNVIRDMLTYVVSFTMLLVAGFGIYNIMNMVITGKLKDIAILKAQGFDRQDIVQIFLSQSLIIGAIGGLTGLLLGFIMSYSLSRVPFPKDEWVIIRFFPVTFEIKYYVFGLLFGLLTTLIAGWMPSRKAARIDPVAILRG